MQECLKRQGSCRQAKPAKKGRCLSAGQTGATRDGATRDGHSEMSQRGFIMPKAYLPCFSPERRRSRSGCRRRPGGDSSIHFAWRCRQGTSRNQGRVPLRSRKRGSADAPGRSASASSRSSCGSSGTVPRAQWRRRSHRQMSAD